MCITYSVLSYKLSIYMLLLYKSSTCFLWYLFLLLKTYWYQLNNLVNMLIHANPGAVRKRAGSSSYISIHIFRKFSNTSVNNNVSLWIYKSWLRYFNLEPSFKLQWCHARDLFGSQIPGTTGSFELRISCIRSSYLAY